MKRIGLAQPAISPRWVADATGGDCLPDAILALDLGTATGWAMRGIDGLITSGTASFRSGRYDGGGMRYLRFTNWITELDRLGGPRLSNLMSGLSATA